MIRIVAAEDSYLIREGMRLLLATQDDIDLVTSVSTLPELLAAVDRHGPDVVVTDIRMPPGNADEGIQAAESLAGTHPGLGVVVLSQYVEPEWALRLFDPGAKGRAYLLKERIGDIGQIRNAIETVQAGGSVLDPLVVEALVHARTAKTPACPHRQTAPTSPWSRASPPSACPTSATPPPSPSRRRPTDPSNRGRSPSSISPSITATNRVSPRASVSPQWTPATPRD